MRANCIQSAGKTPTSTVNTAEITIDVTSGEYSIGAPVYLVTDGDGKLRGGVQGTYTNKKDKDGKRKGDFALGLFIGVPFTIFP